MTHPIIQPRLALAGEIAGLYAALPQVQAVVVAGSLGDGSSSASLADSGSDIDMYVYQTAEISPAERLQVAVKRGAIKMEIDNRFWETGDEWMDAPTGIALDVMFRSPEWIEDQQDRVLRRHEAWVGYSTCFWYNVLHSLPLYDPTGWYARLQADAQAPYPEPLVQAVIYKNHPILRGNISAYSHQLEKAIRRGDLVSVNHRLAAFLASYFDILFAANRLPHPGEKRLVEYALAHCKSLPLTFAGQVNRLIQLTTDPGPQLLAELDLLVDGLDGILPPALMPPTP